MNLLMVTPHLPYPPRRGAAIRNYYFLRWLAERHRVTLLALSARPEVPEHLRDLCAEVITVPPAPRRTLDRLRDLVASPYPDLALRLRTQPFADALLRLLATGRFDAVQVECLETTWAWLWALARLPEGVRRPISVFDDHNAEYLLQWRAFRTDVSLPRRWPAAAYSLVQTAKLRRYEAGLCDTFDGLVAVSNEDATALRGIRRGLRPLAIPNGVDCSLFPFSPPTTDRPAQIVFTGTMDYRPNVDAVVWFVQEVLPLVKRRVPGATFAIVGTSPAPAVRALADVPGVTVTGAVPEVGPYLANSRVYAVPLRVGGGTRLKVLEAMASGLPLVSTTLGCAGIEAEPGRHYLRADGPEAFAAAVVRVLAGEVEPLPMLRAARDLVESRYDWSRVCPALAEVYESARAHRGQRQPA